MQQCVGPLDAPPECGTVSLGLDRGPDDLELERARVPRVEGGFDECVECEVAVPAARRGRRATGGPSCRRPRRRTGPRRCASRRAARCPPRRVPSSSCRGRRSRRSRLAPRRRCRRGRCARRRRRCATTARSRAGRPVASAYSAHGATASAKAAASSSNDRPSRRPVVKYVHPPPSSAARSIAPLTVLRVVSHPVGSDRSNIPVITVVAAMERSCSAAIAASRPNASTFAPMRPTWRTPSSSHSSSSSASGQG